MNRSCCRIVWWVIGLFVTVPSVVVPNDASSVLVRGVEIDLTLIPEDGRIFQDVRVRLDGAGASVVELGLSDDVRVERSRSSSGIVEHRHSRGRLRLIVDPPIREPRTVELRITGRPRLDGENAVREDWAALDPNADWYPRSSTGLHDAVIRVRAPDHWSVTGPGAAKRLEDGTWELRPVRAVRDLAIVGLAGARQGGTPAGKIPVRVLTPTGADVDPVVVGETFADPMTWFSAALAPYPFDGFSLAVVPGLPHPIVASGVTAVPDERVPSGRADAASLLDEQWYGQWLAADGPWIRAFGAWHAWMYALDRRLAPPDDLRRFRDEYRDLSPGRDVAIARADRTTPDAIVRGKGSAAPEMVRSVIGHQAFGRLLERWMSRAPSRIGIAELREQIRAESGDLGVAAFEQWFERTGLPRLRVTLRTMPSAGSGFRADVRIEQLRGVYLLPLDIVLVGVDARRTETVVLDQEETNLRYVVPFRPQRIDVDPLERLFQDEPERVGP